MTEGESNEGLAGQKVMPFYLVCDVSGSMVGDMKDLADGLNELHEEIMSDPIVDDLVMLSIITFNHGASTLVPLSPPTEITMPPLPPAGGLTSYGAAFREYHKAFEGDSARLKAKGLKILRPCVFFLTDGEPTDQDYRQTFQSLLAYDKETQQGNPAYPYICAFGFRDATRQTMEALAYPTFGDRRKRGRWFIAKDGHTPGELLKAMAGVIGKSILQSAQSAISGAPTIAPPESVSGMAGGVVGGTSFV